MGEISDMMLDGTLCHQCGAYIGGAVGYARTCNDCKQPAKRPPLQGKKKCPHCNRWLRGEQGLADHLRASHGGA